MTPNPRRWKTNFRCALNALPDIEEVTEKSCTRGNNAFKVYRMKPMPRAVTGFRGRLNLLEVLVGFIKVQMGCGLLAIVSLSNLATKDKDTGILESIS